MAFVCLDPCRKEMCSMSLKGIFFWIAIGFSLAVAFEMYVREDDPPFPPCLRAAKGCS